jgi:Aspartyl protease/Sel1 repeat
VRRPRLPICAHLCHLRINSLRLRIHRPMSSADQKAPEIQLPPHFTHPRPVRCSQPPTLKCSEEIPRARSSPTRIPATPRIGFTPALAFAAAVCFALPNAHGEDPVEANARTLPTRATPSAAPKAPEPNIDHLTDIIVLASKGDPKAETDLGWAYIYGKDGVPTDLTRGFDLLTKAAKQGDGRAECSLASLYEFADGEKHNDAVALYWYKKAEAQGYPDAQEVLGDAFLNGWMGRPVDRAKARSCYRKAALSGVSSSDLRLAGCYYSGIGGPIDKGKALLWALRAAENGDTQAAWMAAEIYREGAGAKKPNLDLAWIWSAIADRAGLPSDELRKKNAELRKKLAADMPSAQRIKDDDLASRYQGLTAADACVLLPNLVGRPEVSIEPSSEYQKIELFDSAIALPVYIFGKGPFRFILDTGAPCSVIDSKLSKRLHLSSLGVHPSMGNREENENLVEADYAVFQCQARHGVFTEMAFGEIFWAGGMPIDGILGADFIGSCVVEIDYEAQTVRFLDANAYYHDPSLGAEFPLEFENGLPMIQASVGGLHHESIRVPVFIDTGNAGSLDLNLAFDREHHFAQLVPKTFPTHASTAYGTMQGRQGRLQSLELGPYQIAGPLAQCDGLVRESSPKGSLGSDDLRRFKVTLDYQHKRMLLEPNANLKKRVQRDWTGFEALPETPDSAVLRVVTVYPHSPASEAGLRVGDTLTEWNGDSGLKMTHTWFGPVEFSDSASSPDPKESSGKVERRGKIISFKLTPEPY